MLSTQPSSGSSSLQRVSAVHTYYYCLLSDMLSPTKNILLPIHRFSDKISSTQLYTSTILGLFCGHYCLLKETLSFLHFLSTYEPPNGLTHLDLLHLDLFIPSFSSSYTTTPCLTTHRRDYPTSLPLRNAQVRA